MLNKEPLVWLKNGHVNTIFASEFRKVPYRKYKRERVRTPDQDFIDVDWVSKKNNKSLIVFTHGLEGSSRRGYIQGMINKFSPQGYDCLAWNFRSCSGEINRTRKYYHSGISDELDFVVNYSLDKKDYQSIFLFGFSIGGNVTLKYLGEQGRKINSLIKKAIVFSVPLDLEECSNKLSKGFGKVTGYILSAKGESGKN